MEEDFKDPNDRLLLSLDVQLPWDSFLSKEFLPNVYHRKSSNQIAAWKAISEKLNDEQDQINEKNSVTVIKHSLELAQDIIKDDLAKSCMYTAMKDLLMSIMEKENVQDVTESIVLKNAVKYMEKVIKSTMSNDTESVSRMTSFLIEFLNSYTILSLGKNELLKDNKTFSALVDLVVFLLNRVHQEAHPKVFKALQKHLKRFCHKKALFKKDKSGKEFIHDLLFEFMLSEGNATSASYIAFMATILSCLFEKSKQLTPDQSTTVIKFYQDNVLSSRALVSTSYTSIMGVFFSRQIDATTFSSTLSSLIDRLLLRSPEVVLPHLLVLFPFLNLDCGSLLIKMADGLLNNMKSSNELVRSSAQNLFIQLATKTSEKDRVTIAETVIKGFTSKSPSPDQKVLFCSAFASLSVFPHAISDSKTAFELVKVTVDKMISLILKEQNDTVYITWIHDCFSPFLKLLSSFNIENIELLAFMKNAVIPFFESSMKQQQNNTSRRNAIVQSLVSTITKSIAASLSSELAGIKKTLAESVQKVEKAGLGLLDPKKDTPLFTEGVCAFGWLKSIGEIEGNPAFMFNEKLFSKLLPLEEDQSYFGLLILQLIETKPALLDDPSVVNILIYLCIETSLHAVRKVMLNELSSLAIKLKSPELILNWSKIMVKALSRYLETPKLAVGQNDHCISYIISSGNTGYRIFKFLASIVPKIDSHVGIEDHSSTENVWPAFLLHDLLIEFLDFSCHPLLKKCLGSDIWTTLCFQCSVDPVDVLKQRMSEIIQNFIDNFDTTDGLKKNTFENQVELLTLVTPELFLAEIMPYIKNYCFNVNSLKELTSTDIDIWKTPEGTLFTPSPFKPQKTKLDVRMENDKKAKKGDHAQVKAEREWTQHQLEKESEIRKGVAAQYALVNKGLCILNRIFSVVESLSQLSQIVSDNTNADFENAIHTTGFNIIQDDEEDIFCMQLGEYTNLILDSILQILSIEAASPLRRSVLQTLYGFGAALSGPLKRRLFSPVPIYFVALLRTLKLINADDKLESHACEYGTFEGLDTIKLIEICLKVFKENHSPSLHFPSYTFAIVFPLLEAIVLKKNIIISLSGKQYMSLVMPAAETLIAHAALGYDNTLHRERYVDCLANVIHLYPVLLKTGKEAWLTFFSAAANASFEPLEEDGSSPIDGPMVSSSTATLIRKILDHVLSESKNLRELSLLALAFFEIPADVARECDVKVWAMMSDLVPEVQSAAQALWEVSHPDGDKLPDSALNDLSALATESSLEVQYDIAKSCSLILGKYTQCIPTVLQSIYDRYCELLAPPVPKYDEYGMVIKSSLEMEDKWYARHGLATLLMMIAPLVSEKKLLVAIFRFLIDDKAIGDSHAQTRKVFLQAGKEAIDGHGKNFIKELLEVFESYLSLPDGGTEKHDLIKQNVIVLLGTLAKHLGPTDPRIPQVISRLISMLTTPSESVQISVAECLPGLMKAVKKVEFVKQQLDDMINMLFTSEKYGDRRGAAYGIAGIVKGRGLSSLKEFAIMDRLKEAVSDKKNKNAREGSMFAFETLSNTLSRSFEPYVIQILPLLLQGYGDASGPVRQAADDACRVIMSHLSGHCVKLVLPSLLKGLEDENWRTKVGSIEVLGSMTALAPKQLSISLPQIIPKLCEVLTDSHAKVTDSAKRILNKFGDVIKNPEISSLVPTILEALVDPNEKTDVALRSLMETAFVHYIDAASLALIIPVLKRGLYERSTDTKSRASQIMGSMTTLTEQRDLVPYLPGLMPGLREVLVDPVPTARATAAKALGSLVEKLGEEVFPTIVTDMLQILKSETSGVDSAGAAQGLSEILKGIGIHRLDQLMPEFISNTNSTKAYVREGFMTILVYLPLTFGDAFAPYLEQSIPIIVSGLSDESEFVREAALKAGQMVVKKYASSAIGLLLPQLEKGMFDENWRIRESSTRLLGDLLYQLAGISGRGGDITGDDEDDEEKEEAPEEVISVDSYKQALIQALGIERYHKVLASIYMLRADVHSIVRQSSIHVWKSIIVNTPRTLRQIFPVLMNMIIRFLATEESDMQGVAARTLVDLTRKLGESVLHDVVPILKKEMVAEKASQRQGVCVAMAEIITAAGKHYADNFLEVCVPLIETLLMDSDEDVRQAAAATFDVLFDQAGHQGLSSGNDGLVQRLIQDMMIHRNKEDNSALEALKSLMSVRGNVVMPILVPFLLESPITEFKAQALGKFVTVASQSLVKRVSSILNALVAEIKSPKAPVQALSNALQKFVCSIQSDEGVYQLVISVTELLSSDSVEDKEWGCRVLRDFFSSTEMSFVEYAGDFIVRLMDLLKRKVGVWENSSTLAAWQALEALVKKLKKEELEKFVTISWKNFSRLIEDLDEDQYIEGLSITKGPSALLPIFLQGLMYGNADLKEQSALSLRDIVKATQAEYLKPFVTQIAGPLIRVSGDRLPSGTKEGVLKALGEMLLRVPLMVKPFLPQLQRTFLKSLLDSEFPNVQKEGSRALSMLIPLQPRLDPFVLELSSSISNTNDVGVLLPVLEATYSLLNNLKQGREISEASNSALLELIEQNLFKDSKIWEIASKCLAAYLTFNTKKADNLLQKYVYIKDTVVSADKNKHQVSLMALNALVQETVNVSDILDLTLVQSIITKSIQSQDQDIVELGVKTASNYVQHQKMNTFLQVLLDTLKRDVIASTKREIILTIKFLAKTDYSSIETSVNEVISNLMECIRDRHMAVKLATERALIYVLKLKTAGSSVVDEFLKTVPQGSARSVRDYVDRVLIKLVDIDSDKEED